MASSFLNFPAVCRNSSSHSRSDLKYASRMSCMQSPFLCLDGLPAGLAQSKVSMAVGGREASNSSDPSALRSVSMAADSTEASISPDPSVLRGETSVSTPSGSKVFLPPRMCTLREFGEGTVAVDSDSRVSLFFESLAANIEFSSRVQDWEILSGRLAMMVFASAVLLEAITGNSVFQKMDSQRIFEVCGAIFASIVVAAGFAIALQAKSRVAYTVTKGYETMMNGLIDNVFDSLLFDREDS